MDKSTDFARPIRDGPKRRRRDLRVHIRPRRGAQAPSTSGSESPPPSEDKLSSPAPSLHTNDNHAAHSDNDTDQQIQRNNAYPGSCNTIGSIHQRRWYLSLDRWNSGFEAVGPTTKKKQWVRRQSESKDGPLPLGFEPFYVRGPEIERSVVTGRLGGDVLADEGVEDFVARRGWRAVLH